MYIVKYVYTMSLYVSSPGQRLNEPLPLIGIRCSPSLLTVSHFNLLLPYYSRIFFILSIHQQLMTFCALSCEVTFHSSSTAQSKQDTKYILASQKTALIMCLDLISGLEDSWMVGWKYDYWNDHAHDVVRCVVYLQRKIKWNFFKRSNKHLILNIFTGI